MNILILYSPEDANYWHQLQKHLAELQRQKVISTYHEGSMVAGSTIATAMQNYLQSADMVLLLVSPDFLASDQQYHYAEQALQMGKRVVPIIVRPCMWQDAAWGKLAMLPIGGKAISQYDKPDEGFYEVVLGLRRLIEPNYKPDGDKKSPLFDVKKTAKVLAAIVGIVSFLAGIAQLTGYSLRDIWGGGNKRAATNHLSVYVHGNKGKTDALPQLYRKRKIALQKEGSFKPEVELIDDKGVATFEIAADLVGQKAHIDIFQENEGDLPYKSTHPDSLYTLNPEQAIYLEVKLHNNDTLRGTITDAQTHEFLPNVRVSIADQAAQTDQYGYFKLPIPTRKQNELYQTVTLSKTGYETKTLKNIPIQTPDELNEQLKPKP